MAKKESVEKLVDMAKINKPVETMPKEEVNEKINNIANDVFEGVAEYKGYEKTQDFINDLKVGAEIEDRAAIQTIEGLAQMIVRVFSYSYMISTNITELIKKFVVIENQGRGAGARFEIPVPTTPTNYDPNKFVPDKLKETPALFEIIKFYKDDNKTLTDYAFKKLFSMVYSRSTLIAYFLNSQLSEFLANQIHTQIEQSPNLFMYDYLMTKLTDTVNTDGTTAKRGLFVKGTAKDAFQCWTKEIFPTIRRMTQNNDEFNVEANLDVAHTAITRKDLILLAHPDVLTLLENNLQSQLYNSAKIDPYLYVGHIHASNAKFDFTGEKVKTKKDEYYVAKDTIYVIDKENYFKMLRMLKFDGEQDFVLNMSTLKVLHLWLAAGYLPWGKVFTYKNANLLISPSDPQEVA